MRLERRRAACASCGSRSCHRPRAWRGPCAATTRTPPRPRPRRPAPSRPRSSGPSAGPGTRSRSRTGRWKNRISQLPLLRLAGQLLVGVHRDRMADRLEHRQVGDRVAVRVGRGEVDALAVGDLAHRVGLVRPVRVELELAGVVAVVVDLRPGSRSPRRRRGTRRAGPTTSAGADETITTWRPAAWCWSNSSSASANTIGEITSSSVSRTMSRDVVLAPALGERQHRLAELLHLRLVRARRA